MKFKYILIPILCLGYLISGQYVVKSIDEFGLSFYDLKNLIFKSWPYLSLAFAMQCTGHLLRAQKNLVMVRAIKDEVPFYVSFRSLMVGGLVNVTFPFRIGELVRAHVFGKSAGISRTSILVSIAFERLLDAALILVGSTFWIIYSLLSHLPISPTTYHFMIWFYLSFLIGATGFYTFYRQDLGWRSIFGKISGLFRSTIRDRIRFLFWSVHFSVNLFLKQTPIIIYLSLTLLMWLFYIFAIVILIRGAFPTAHMVGAISLAFLAYMGTLVPSGPAFLGTFQYFFIKSSAPYGLSGENVLAFACLVWALLVIPTFIFGIAVLFIKKLPFFNFHPINEYTSKSPMTLAEVPRNKLRKDLIITPEFSDFLDLFYSGTDLGSVINKMELSSEFRLVKILRGGSNATTALGWNGDALVVRKVVLRQFANKVHEQY